MPGEELQRLRELADAMLDPELGQQIINSLPDALLVVDVEGKIQMVNWQLELLFGYSRQQLLGKNFEILLPENIREVHRTHVGDYFKEPHVRPHFFTMPVRRPMNLAQPLPSLHSDGTIFMTQISIGPLVTPNGIWALALIRRSAPNGR